MSRITDIFTTLRTDSRTALMPFIVGGYPSIDDTHKTILALEQASASIVEIGIPFSDPIADGPVIAGAMHEALAQGVTPRKVLEAVKAIRKKTKLGLIAMVSDSIVERIGAERFVAEAADAGIDGLIVPDLDVDTAEPLVELIRKHDMTLSLLVAPTSSQQRIEKILTLCSGFVYLLARAGITGERDAPPDVSERVGLLRSMTDLPIAVGFGISTPDHVAAATEYADAAIVGSAIVRVIGEAAKRKADPAEAAAALTRDLVNGLRCEKVVTARK